MRVSFIYDRTQNISNNLKFHDAISPGREKGGTKQKQKFWLNNKQHKIEVIEVLCISTTYQEG